MSFGFELKVEENESALKTEQCCTRRIPLMALTV